MKRNVLLTSAVASVMMLGASIGIVSAASSSSSASSTNGQSNIDRIARYTMEDEHVQAVAKVLNTTPSSLEDKLKTETMQQIIKNAGLSESSFRDKVKTQVQSDLLAQGYTQSQIDNTMSRHAMGPRMHHQGNAEDTD